MMDQLLTNIKHVLKDVFQVPWVKFRSWGERLVFQFNPDLIEEGLDALEHVPGILRMHVCVEVQAKPASVAKALRALFSESTARLDPTQVEVRGIYFPSQDQRDSMVTSALEEVIRVASELDARPGNVTGAYIEIFPEFAYVSLESRAGLNGNPIGTQNPVIVEIIGRPSDLEASLLVAKRGAVITPIFFYIGKYAVEEDRLGRFILFCSRLLDQFHGFPVRKWFWCDLHELFSHLPDIFQEEFGLHPCEFCIIARRVIEGLLARELNLHATAVNGIINVDNQQGKGTCQCDLELASSLNPLQVQLLLPTILNPKLVDPAFIKVFQDCPIEGNDITPSTWNFCLLSQDHTQVDMDQARIEMCSNWVERAFKVYRRTILHAFTGESFVSTWIQEKIQTGKKDPRPAGENE